MNCGEKCVCFWCSLYGLYCLTFCGTACYTLYKERRADRDRIIQEYRNLPQQAPPNIEMKIERLMTTPLSTISEESTGYQDFR
tara:strand:+ start:321 stop:569 length:249 start_codon:yes stop_codon:yes gene_type:complete